MIPYSNNTVSHSKYCEFFSHLGVDCNEQNHASDPDIMYPPEGILNLSYEYTQDHTHIYKAAKLAGIDSIVQLVVRKVRTFPLDLLPNEYNSYQTVLRQLLSCFAIEVLENPTGENSNDSLDKIAKLVVKEMIINSLELVKNEIKRFEHVQYLDLLVAKSFIAIWRLEYRYFSKNFETQIELITDWLINLASLHTIKTPFCNYLIELFRQHISIKQSVSNYLVEFSCWKKIDQVKYVDPEMFSQIRFLLKKLVGVKEHPFFLIEDDIANCIKMQRDKLYYSNKEPDKEWKKNRDIYTCWLLNEIFVERSFQIRVLHISPFLDFQNPIKEKRYYKIFNNANQLTIDYSSNNNENEFISPSLSYLKIVDHTIACIFALQMSDRIRNQWHRHFLENFISYSKIQKYYSVQKIILGAVSDVDIPSHDIESPLTERLYCYPGVFRENISDELKNAYWDALEKRFCGNSFALVNGLNSFYKNKDNPPKYRTRALNLLKNIAGISELGIPIQCVENDLVQKYARLMLKDSSSD